MVLKLRNKVLRAWAKLIIVRIMRKGPMDIYFVEQSKSDGVRV